MNELTICKCGCGREFLPPSDAQHKVFATAACRQRWHKNEAKRALAEFRKRDEQVRKSFLAVLQGGEDV